MDQLGLFPPPAPPRPPSARKARALAKHEADGRAYLELLRVAMRAEYDRLQRPVTTDDAWLLIESREDLRIPAGMSHNVLGGLFVSDRDAKGRGRWEVVGIVVSTRDEANGNLLRSWRLCE